MRHKDALFAQFAFDFVCRSRMSTRIILVAISYVNRLFSQAKITNAEADIERHLFDLLIGSVIIAHKVRVSRVVIS